MTFITTIVNFIIMSRDSEKLGEITLKGDVEVRWDNGGERYYMILRDMEEALEQKLGRRVEFLRLSEDNLDRVEIIFAV